MNDKDRMNIRKLLKQFGIASDDALSQWLANNPGKSIKVSASLTTVDDNGQPSDAPLVRVETELGG